MKQHVFARVPAVNIPRSVFPLSHNLKTTMDVDYLYPIFVGEALPADTWVFSQKIFGRMTTPLTPLMDDLYIDTFYFAVPVRLVDDEFKKLMGERPFGDLKNDYVTPMLNTGDSGVAFGSLYDYLGVPPSVPNLDFLSWYPRAYNLVWNEFFRDENLVDGAPVAGIHSDGTVTTEALSDYILRKRGKRHDYYTSCTPWPQKGDAAQMSFSGLSGSVVATGNLQLKYNNPSNNTWQTGYYAYMSNYSNATPGIVTSKPATAPTYPAVSGDNISYVNPSTSPTGRPAVYDGGLGVQFADLPAFTINEFREGVAMQHLLEQWARGGTRYTELLRSCFGVVSPDARLQRPEYLGGSSQALNVTTIAQTSETTASSPLGNLASFVTMTNDASFTKSFTEHTIIIGLCNIRANLTYSQGLNRMFSRRTKFDFYWPALANLGEQVVKNREIFAQGDSVLAEDGVTPVDDGVFGYQERWAEYRYMPNRLTGLMRPTAPNSLDAWHLSQKFDNLPVLNDEFIQESVPIDRVVAVTDEPPFLVDAYFDIRAARPMPIYSVPGLNRL
jgi:hypothetical protein